MLFSFSDIPPEIICTAITITGSVFTVIISNRNAKAQAKSVATSEVEKMTKQWLREDKLNAEDEFKTLCESVVRYILDSSPANQSDALVRIIGLRATSCEEIAEILDSLYDSIRHNHIVHAEATLDSLICIKRNLDVKEKESTDRKSFFRFKNH